jgi:hypothetical protein
MMLGKTMGQGLALQRHFAINHALARRVGAPGDAWTV